MGNLLLIFAICFTQLVLGYMGIHMSINPPKPEHKKWWKAAFLIVGLLGIFLTVCLAWKTSDLQDKASADVHKAQEEATNANIAATKANISATNAQRETKEARKEVQILQKTVNESSKKTILTITKWQTDADSAARKLLRSPRVLGTDQAEIIIKVLKTMRPSEIVVRHNGDCNECQQYAGQLAEVIKQGGWTVQARPKKIMQLGGDIHGLKVWIHDATKVPPAADKLLEALKTAGIEVQGQVVNYVDEGAVEIMVGLSY
jgi:hypothetical protein